LIASDSSAAFIAKPKSSGQTSKRSSPILSRGNSTTRFASRHSTRLEHWSEDLSKDIAVEIQNPSDIEGVAVQSISKAFVASHTGPTRQLTLRLA